MLLKQRLKQLTARLRAKRSQPLSSVWALVGLGNPGSKYAGTRHNIGEDVVRLWADSAGAPLKLERKSRSYVASTTPEPGHKVIAALPDCYMNESGGPVRSLLAFYKVPAEHLIVVHDEIDLPYGSLRVKFGGGDNGHNGLRSIRQHLGTGDYYRIRLGVGRGPGNDPIGHVLGRFNRSEQAEKPDFSLLAQQAIACLVRDGLDKCQNQFNS